MSSWEPAQDDQSWNDDNWADWHWWGQSSKSGGGHRHDAAQLRREGKMARLERELQEAQATVKQQEGQLQKAQATVTQLEGQLQEAQASANYYSRYSNSLLDTTQRQLAAKDEKNVEMMAQLEDKLNHHWKGLLLKKEEVITRLLGKIKDLKEVVRENSEAMEQKESLEKELANVQAKLDKERASFKTILEGQKGEIDKKSKELWELQNEKGALEETLRAKNSIIEEKVKQFDALQERFQQARFSDENVAANTINEMFYFWVD